jgi:hypothetical protein
MAPPANALLTVPPRAAVLLTLRPGTPSSRCAAGVLQRTEPHDVSIAPPANALLVVPQRAAMLLTLRQQKQQPCSKSWYSKAMSHPQTKACRTRKGGSTHKADTPAALSAPYQIEWTCPAVAYHTAGMNGHSRVACQGPSTALTWAACCIGVQHFGASRTYSSMAVSGPTALLQIATAGQALPIPEHAYKVQ